MAQDKPIPLVGRLAIQLKMLTPQEVARAMAESESTGNPRLAQVMLQMGLLDRDQIAKLQQVQKELVEKQRVKAAGEAAEGGAAPAPTPTPTSAAAPAPQATPQRRATDVHRAAEHAAKAAAPMTSRDIDDLYEAPSAGAEKAARPLPKTVAPASPLAPPTPSAAPASAARPAPPRRPRLRPPRLPLPPPPRRPLRVERPPRSPRRPPPAPPHPPPSR
ncbi:MAG: hypothetical protein U0900_24565 [Myxococcota bacterium]